jgi:5-methylcytosine-specific restriction endonuclease McrA
MKNKRRRKTMYEKRGPTLRKMGFKSYWEYLQSDLWKKVRAMAFEKNGRVCCCCKGPATQIHHRRYTRKVLEGKNLGMLSPICRPCHQAIEFDGDRKRMVSGANGAIRRRRKEIQAKNTPA